MSIAAVIQVARAQIGKPYVWATAGPNTFDCSGLIVYAAKHGAGKTLPHYTGTMLSYGTKVAEKDLQPGDLVFPHYDHVQLYVGNGMVIEAPQAGIPVREVKMWGFWTARRVDFGGGRVPDSGNTTPVDNPIVPDSFERLADFFSSPDLWRKLAFYFFGTIMIIIGFVKLASNMGAGTVVKTVTKAAKK